MISLVFIVSCVPNTLACSSQHDAGNAQVLLQNMRGRALSRSNDLGLMQGLPPGTAYTASPVLEPAYLEVLARPANLLSKLHTPETVRFIA